MPILYFFEDVQEIKLKKRRLNLWIGQCLVQYQKKHSDINFIFCSDEYLKDLNEQYLKHFYYTDVITFNYSEDSVLSGDIFISTDRVADNARIYNVTFERELLRVIIHGILHLIGFDDLAEKSKLEMTKLEDQWLTIYYDKTELTT